MDDAVARQDTIMQLVAAVRRFGREVPGGPALLAAVDPETLAGKAALHVSWGNGSLE